MSFVIEIAPGKYEGRTSTLRAFGGRFQFTDDIREAKRLTRKSDAEKRHRLLQQHKTGYYEYKKQFQPKLEEIQLCVIKEIK